MEFLRRVGIDPHSPELDDPQTPQASGCPDIWELADGRIAIIGGTISNVGAMDLPAGVSCGPDESMIVFPRAQLKRAAGAIGAL